MKIDSAKYIKDTLTKANCSIAVVDDGINRIVPLDEDNTDYQEIQEWVAKGNTIEEAD
tara:strand:- start:1585 stop:1758 length:174 start_codon:yes stop_codon:yes gene_type:complete